MNSPKTDPAKKIKAAPEIRTTAQKIRDQKTLKRSKLEQVEDRLLLVASKLNVRLSLSNLRGIKEVPQDFLEIANTNAKLDSRLKRRLIEQYICQLPLHILNPTIDEICKNDTPLRINIKNYFPNGQIELNQSCLNYLSKIVESVTLKLGKTPTISDINHVLTFRGLPIISSLGSLIDNPVCFIRNIANQTSKANKDVMKAALFESQKQEIIFSIIESLEKYHSDEKGKISESAFRVHSLVSHLRLNPNLDFDKFYFLVKDIFEDWSHAISAAYKEYTTLNN
jgi:hypothetical protein